MGGPLCLQHSPKGVDDLGNLGNKRRRNGNFVVVERSLNDIEFAPLPKGVFVSCMLHNRPDDHCSDMAHASWVIGVEMGRPAILCTRHADIVSASLTFRGIPFHRNPIPRED